MDRKRAADPLQNRDVKRKADGTHGKGHAWNRWYKFGPTLEPEDSLLLNNRQANRRRGRGRGPQNTGGRNDNASRIDSRARGNAPQMLEKYKNMARDAQMQGDRVMTEYYLQFADHYFRIVAESRARFEEQRRQRDDWNGEEEEGSDNEGNFDSGYGNEGDADGQQDQQRDYRQNSNNNRQDRDRGDRDAG